MRCFLIAVLVFLLVPAAWAQPADGVDYFRARDRGRAMLNETFGRCGDAQFPPEGREREFESAVGRLDGELEAMMRRMLDPLTAPKGFSGHGSWQTSPSTCGMGMDALDGIVWSETKGGGLARVLVTTEGVLRRWLAINEPPHPELQADPDGGFRTGALTASVIDQDGWTAVFAFLPIARPAGVDALTVFVGLGGNGTVIWPPNEIAVYLRKGGRVYIANTPLLAPFAQIEACDLLRRGPLAAARDPGEPIDDRYNKCWEARGRSEPAFAAAVEQARKFVEDLAAQ